jgi:ABC-type glutathione transport system ATPase component
MVTILHVENLVVEYPTKYGLLGNVISKYKAVNGISFDINYGEIVGIIGESGCGKSSLAKALIGLVPMKADKIVFDFEYNIHPAIANHVNSSIIIYEDGVPSAAKLYTNGNNVFE